MMEGGTEDTVTGTTVHSRPDGSSPEAKRQRQMPDEEVRCHTLIYIFQSDMGCHQWMVCWRKICPHCLFVQSCPYHCFPHGIDDVGACSGGWYSRCNRRGA